MEDLFCEMCGSTNLKEVNGIVTCQACDTKYPEISLSKIGIDEELKNQEIKRLIKVNNKRLTLPTDREPKVGLLSDDEILKYAPNSQAAIKIRTKRANGFMEKVEVNPLYQSALIVGVMLLFFVLLLIFLISVA